MIVVRMKGREVRARGAPHSPPFFLGKDEVREGDEGSVVREWGKMREMRARGGGRYEEGIGQGLGFEFGLYRDRVEFT